MRNFDRVLVTGATGFIGSVLVELLLAKGHTVLAVDDLSKGARSSLPPDSDRFTFTRADLRDRNTALKVIRDCDWVIHLASHAYGVAYCSRNHANAFFLNSQINANTLEAVAENHIPGILSVSSSCVYSDDAPDGMPEEAGFIGDPELTNWGYGWAKRMLEIATLAAVQDSKCEGVIVRPVNVYGANYGWFGENSHVIPALVKRVLSGERPLKVWGDGNQARSFMHVKDIARCMPDISLKAPNATVVNIGDEHAISINDILAQLRDVFDMDFEVRYDLSKPTGRKVKSVSGKKLRELLPGFQPSVSLRDGLMQMREWYYSHRAFGSF